MINKIWNNLFVQLILFICLSWYLVTKNNIGFLKKIQELYPNVKKLQNETDIGWEYIPYSSSTLSNGVVYSLSIIGFIITLFFDYKNKTAYSLYYVNLVIIAHLIYLNTTIVTRLPNTFQGKIHCDDGGLLGMENCSQKIPSGHACLLVINGFILSTIFPKYTILFIILTIIGNYFLLAGRLHRSVDVLIGITIGLLLCIARPKNKIYSVYLAVSLVISYIILLHLLKNMSSKYKKNRR